MSYIRRTTTLIAMLTIMSIFSLVACDSPTAPNEGPEGPEGGAEGSAGSEGAEGTEGAEHAEGSEGSGSEPGESGVQYGLDETFDEIQSGAHLIMFYDAPSSTFLGTVENTTNGILRRVRVEVHLSNGVELGPTTPVDLAPGQMTEVMLSAAGQVFVTWSAHPEVG